MNTFIIKIATIFKFIRYFHSVWIKSIMITSQYISRHVYNTHTSTTAPLTILLYVIQAKTYLPIRFLEHKTREQIYVEFSEQLHLFTDYSLHMEFKGDIDTSLAGFYRSNYFDPLSNTTKLVATS